MHSAVDGHLSWFQLGAVHTKAAEKAGGPVWWHLHTPSRLWSGLVGPWGRVGISRY